MNYKSFGLLLLIVAIGVFFRFVGLNWDQGFHLHPDERFLTMVGVAGKIPDTLSNYLNPSISPFNPANNNFTFFVYGIFPVTLTKLLAILLHMDSYEKFNILGRILSALFDTITIFLVFLTAKLLTEKQNLPKNISLLAALFYAIAVLPIQLSHFFTVDIFLNFFTFLSFYLLLRFYYSQRKVWFIISAIAFGISLACKISSLALLPLIFFIILLTNHIKLLNKVVFISAFLLLSYVALRFADPYMFAYPNILNPSISPQFLHSVETLSSYNDPASYYPPGIQWIHKMPVFFSAFNISFFGLGVFYTLCTLIGIFFFFKTKKILYRVIASWALLFFFYQSTQYVKTMRYFLVLYPFFAIFAAYGYAYISQSMRKTFLIFLGMLIFLWPILFINIYTKPHTRVSASYWIEKHIPAHSTILTEYWDDPLPLQVPGIDEKEYKTIEIPVFTMDTPEKWELLKKDMAGTNYLVLSSNRGWGSILAASDRYPQMSLFYQDLFAGKLPYKKIAEFTSYPSFSYLGIPLTIPDDAAEEAFTVFDHPKVLIFKKD